MISRWKFGLLTCVLCAAVGCFAQGKDPQISVSVFNDADVPNGVLVSARNQAVQIFRRAGVQLVWLDCSGTRRPEACLKIDSVAHFSLRVIPKATRLKSEIFGIAFLGGDGRGTQADIFFDRVRRFASDSQFDLGAILGQVAVHELGHLMLGTNSHSTSGIMRAQWRAEELKLGSRGGPYFINEQEVQIREKLCASCSAREESAMARLQP